MKFKTFQLIKNNKFLSTFDCQVIMQSKINEHIYGEEIYLIEKKFIDNRFLWLYFQYDNLSLYGEKVLDLEEFTSFENNRKRSHIELRKQLFAVYDTEKEILYMNDYAKKALVKNYLTFSFDEPNIMIKNIYSTLDDFENAVSILNKVKFTRTKKLIESMEPDDIFSRPGNIYGLDMPDKYTLDVQYTALGIGGLHNILKNIKRKYDSGYFEDIVLIGKDEEGFEKSLNFSTMIKNVKIDPLINENNRYDDKEVQKMIIGVLEK